MQIGRGVFEPGWRWSEHVKQLAGTDSCQSAHTGYVIQGRMIVRMDNGVEVEYATGNAFFHAARPRRVDRRRSDLHLIDVTGMSNYAKSE